MRQAEFRGCDNLVVAKVTKDDSTGYTTGSVIALAPIASVAKSTETSAETHFYDNTGMIQIRADGVDTITLVVPAMYLEKLAIVTGAYIDPVSGAYMSGEDTNEEYALGYRIKLTDGTYRYVWRLKGTFSNVPDESSNTESNSVDTQNQTVTFSGTKTIYEFPTVGRKRDIVIDERDGICDCSTFFNIVQTPATVSQLVSSTTTAISVSPTTSSLVVDGTATITATTTPSGNHVSWVSSNPSVASVATQSGSPSNYGQITANGVGTAIVTAVSGSYSASVTVTVTAGA